MHQLLEKAFDRASSLPAPEQEALARRVLAELDADVCWDDLLARAESDDLLTRLADRALDAHRAGRTRPLDSDDL
jgi:alkylhydroperoxidase family enzyme